MSMFCQPIRVVVVLNSIRVWLHRATGGPSAEGNGGSRPLGRRAP